MLRFHASKQIQIIQRQNSSKVENRRGEEKSSDWSTTWGFIWKYHGMLIISSGISGFNHLNRLV